MSGKPSIRHTTLAAFLSHSWSQTGFHNPLCSTSTRPSWLCFPPLRRIPVNPLAIPTSSRTRKTRRKNAMSSSQWSIRRNIKCRVDWILRLCKEESALFKVVKYPNLMASYDWALKSQCRTAKEKPAEWRFPFAGADRDRLQTCRKNEIGYMSLFRRCFWHCEHRPLWYFGQWDNRQHLDKNSKTIKALFYKAIFVQLVSYCLDRRIHGSPGFPMMGQTQLARENGT